MTLIVVTADVGSWLADVLVGGLKQAIAQLVCLVVPFVVIAIMLRALEHWVQLTLARRFGWRSILWTGWLGTPIHELSHVVLCVVFRHRVHEISLFSPDLEAGRLGYVTHSYAPRNHWQKLVNYDIGNFFIGVAPLAGGAVVLYGLLWAFFPEVPKHALEGEEIAETIADGRLGDAVISFANVSQEVLAGVLRPEHIVSWRLWVFLYLTLCVGGHMAPSASDLSGARRGAILLGGVLLVANIAFLVCGGEQGALLAAAARVVSPVLAVFLISALVCAISSAIVVGLMKIADYVIRE